MYDRNPLYDNLSLEERKELTKLTKNLSVYIADLDQQRKDLKEAKIRKEDIEKYVFYTLCPPDEEFFRVDSLQRKIWGA